MKKIILLGLLFLFLSSCSKNVNIDIENRLDLCIASLAHDYREAKELSEIGFSIVRPHPGDFIWEKIENENGEFDFSETDKWVKRMQRENIELVVTLFPYAKWDQLECKSENQCKVSDNDLFAPKNSFDNHYIPEFRCAPCNEDRYVNFVKKLVERYDGDGTDDMEGLIIPIKYYEINNEPELQGGDLVFFKGTKEEFLQMSKVGYESIKEACSDCKVLHGGAAGSMDTLRYWEELHTLGIGNYYDIANIHYISSWDKTTLNVKDYKALLDRFNINKPIWVTEAEIKPGENYEIILNGAINAGASKVFLVFYDVLEKNEAISLSQTLCE